MSTPNIRRCKTIDEADALVLNGKDLSPHLVLAAQEQDVDMLQYLVGHGADPKKVDQSDWNYTLTRTNTLSIKEIEFLLKCGADINAREVSGNKWTLLMDAVAWNKVERVQFLIEHGADISLKDIDNDDNLLSIAASCGSDKCAALLLDQYGFDVEAMNNESETPLMAAARRGKTKLVKVLVEHGANLENNSDDVKHTPLTYAVIHGHIESAKALLDFGADINAKSADGSTPLILAAINGQAETVNFLLNRGANLHAVDNWQNNALHGAAQLAVTSKPIMAVAQGEDYWSTLRILMDAGIDSHARDWDSKTALEIAQDHHNDKAVAVIQSGMLRRASETVLSISHEGLNNHGVNKRNRI